MFSGVLVPVVTPFLGRAVDEDGFAAHVETLLAADIGGLVVGGIAGEGPTLTTGERARLVHIAADIACSRRPVIAATGTNCTNTTIRATNDAKAAGASAALLVAPYYNKPMQEGLFRHVDAVARACDLPLILHNAPQRTNTAFAVPTLERLAALSAVVALIDEEEDPRDRLPFASGAPGPLVRIAPGCLSCAMPGMPLPNACMDMLGNALPRLCARLWSHRLAGHDAEAAMLAVTLAEFGAAIDREPQPVGIKHAVSLMMPAFAATPRLPLTPASPASAAAIRAALAALGAIPDDRRPLRH